MDSRAGGKRALDLLIGLVFVGGMFLVAVPLALVMLACGASSAAIMLAMGACGLVGAGLGRRATKPGGAGRGSLPAPPALRPKRAPKTRQPQN